MDNDLTLSDKVGKLNMMSDRAANEEKEDKLLGQWKTEVVADQQTQVMNNFYCDKQIIACLNKCF